jgi:hypothetical protein
MTAELHRTLLAHLAGLLTPITSIASADDLEARLAAIGWDLDALTGFDTTALVTALTSTGQAVAEVVQVLDGGGPEDLLEYAGAAVKLGTAAGQVFAAIQAWDPPTGIDTSAAGLLAGDLTGSLLYGYLGTVAPRLAAALELAGLVRHEASPQLTRDDGRVVRAAMDRPVVDLGALGDMLTDPAGALARRFRDAPNGARRAADAIADLAGPPLAATLQALGPVAGYGIAGPGRGLGLTPDELAAARRLLIVETPPDLDPAQPVRESFRLVAGLTDDTGGEGLGLVLAPSGELTLAIGDLTVTLEGDVEPVLVTGSGVAFDSAATGLRVTLSISYDRVPQDGSPVLRFGAADGTRFQLGSLRTSAGVELADGAPNLVAAIEVGGVELAVSAGDGDGFLQKVLPAKPIEARADLAAEWSLRGGFRFRGSGRFQILLPARFSLGPVQVESAVIVVELDQENVSAVLAVTASLTLGPFAAAVEGIGLRALLRPDAPGEVAAVEFKPPDGAGLALDASVVVGGGYLFADHKLGRYGGVLQLEIQDTIALTAIGIITARRPDGSPGFSLLVIIAAEFPPIQLGFGFTLTGVGGLIGANRTMAVDVLRAGVRNRTLDAILFPKDPVARAPQIIATLEATFPQADGRFVIGLMGKFGWGTPTVLTLEVGLLIELPAPVRLVVLGRLTLVLPTADAAVVEIHMDVVGVIDFDHCDASVDATLYDSRVAGFVITGDMALRLNWGTAPTFALAAGGFNPRFEPPPAFPALDRLAISLADSDNPRLRLEAYLATTANSVQMGARLDVHAGLDLGLLGRFSASAYLGFDALVYLLPKLSFVVDIFGAAEIRRDDKPFLSADVRLTLTGPEPWHAWGEATFTFLGKRRIEVDVTIGEEPPGPALPPVDPLGDLVRALSDPRSWSAQLPADGHSLVTLRAVDPAAGTGGDVLAHPLGRLSVEQHVLPLDVDISRYGGVSPPVRRFTLSAVLLGTQEAAGWTPTRDAFPPGQFLDLTEDEKLSRPAFEQLPSGCTDIVSSDLAAGPAVTGGGAYDTVVVDAEDRAATQADYTVHSGVVPALVAVGAAARTPMATGGRARYAGPPLGVAVDDPRYRVVSADDLAGPDTVYGSWTEAASARGGAPGQQVIGAYEGAAP